MGWPTGNGKKLSNSQANCAWLLPYFFPFPVGHLMSAGCIYNHPGVQGHNSIEEKLTENPLEIPFWYCDVTKLFIFYLFLSVGNRKWKLKWFFSWFFSQFCFYWIRPQHQEDIWKSTFTGNYSPALWCSLWNTSWEVSGPCKALKGPYKALIDRPGE